MSSETIIALVGMVGAMFMTVVSGVIYLSRLIDSKLSTSDFKREFKELELRLRLVERAIARLYARKGYPDDLNGPK